MQTDTVFQDREPFDLMKTVFQFCWFKSSRVVVLLIQYDAPHGSKCDKAKVVFFLSFLFFMAADQRCATYFRLWRRGHFFGHTAQFCSRWLVSHTQKPHKQYEEKKKEEKDERRAGWHQSEEKVIVLFFTVCQFWPVLSAHVSVYLHLKDGEDVWERTKLLTLRCFCSLEPVIYSCIPNKFWSLYSIWSGLKTVKNNINVQLSSKCYLNHHKTKCNVKMAEAVICG